MVTSRSAKTIQGGLRASLFHFWGCIVERFESFCFWSAAVGFVLGCLLVCAGILLGSADVVVVGVVAFGGACVAATLLG